MQFTSTRLTVAILLAFVTFVISAAPAAAQRAPARSPRGTGWVFEIHVGSMPSKLASKVRNSQLPPPGPGFTTLTGDPSRQVPSWYFGDGAALANGVVAGSGLAGIVRLDPVLTTSVAGRQSGTSFGFHIGHTITRRVLLGFSFDQVPGELALTDSAVAAIAATSASFKPFWDALFSIRPATANATTSSSFTIANNTGSQKLIAVTAEIRITTIRGWTPYVTVGGGIGLPLPSIDTRVTLVGHYQFNFNNPGGATNGALVSETDQVQVRYEVQAAPIGILGAGVERNLTGHLGVRADFRAFIGANTVSTRLDTRPISGPTTPPFANQRYGTNPSLQVSTNSPTSLSLQGVDHFESFSAKGDLPSFSIGFFFRF